MLFALRADVGSVLKFLANVRPVSPFSKLIKEKKTINQRQVTTLGLKSSWHTVSSAVPEDTRTMAEKDLTAKTEGGDVSARPRRIKRGSVRVTGPEWAN
jgi:hypothetical protein